MATPVYQPKRADEISSILPIAGAAAGAVAGGISGGPGGALEGGAKGQALGGTANSALEMIGAKGAPQQASVPTSAVDRRMQFLQASQNPVSDIAAGRQALASMPPQIRQEYEEPLRKAQALAERSTQGRRYPGQVT